MKHAIETLKEELKFQKSKLKSEVKVWEAEMKLRIEEKISDLEKAIEILNQNKNGTAQ